MVLLMILLLGSSGYCSETDASGMVIVAVRTDSVAGLGHVGVAFQNANGTWTAGSVEGAVEKSWYNWGGAFIAPFGKKGENGGWFRLFNTREEVENEFAKLEYDKYKIIPVENCNPESANDRIRLFDDLGYVPAVNDCLTEIWGVLDAYGFKNPGFVVKGKDAIDTLGKSVERLGELAGATLYPNDYYASLPGEEIALEQQSSSEEAAKSKDSSDSKESSSNMDNGLSFGEVQESIPQTGNSGIPDAPGTEKDANSEGRKLASEDVEENRQSNEPSEDTAEILDPASSETETAKTSDDSNIEESSRATMLYPVTSPLPNEGGLPIVSEDLKRSSQSIAPPIGQFKAKSFQKGDKVATTDLLNVRSEPGLPADDYHDTRISEPKGKGSTGIILSDEPIYADGFAWWKIQYDDGTIGWSQDKRLELQQTETRSTASQEKQPETQEASNPKFGPYSEGKILEAEAFGETSAREGKGIRTLHSETSPLPDESRAKERSEIRTLHPGTSSSSDESGAQEGQEGTKLYPVTSQPPDESDTNGNALQVSDTDLSDYAFLRDKKKSSNLEWAVKGSGDKGRPAYKQPATAQGFQDNTRPIQSQRSSLIDRSNSNGNSIVGEWNIIQTTTPHELFGGSIQIQFVATFSPDGSVSRPRQQQGKMWIGASTGSWTQNGDSVRWTIAEVTHEGTVQGNRMSGVIYSSAGQSSWSAERV